MHRSLRGRTGGGMDRQTPPPAVLHPEGVHAQAPAAVHRTPAAVQYPSPRGPVTRLPSPQLATPVPLPPRTLRRVLAPPAPVTGATGHRATARAVTRTLHGLTHLPAGADAQAVPHRRAADGRMDGRMDAAHPRPGPLWVGVTPRVSLCRCPSPRVGASLRVCRVSPRWCGSLGVRVRVSLVRLSLWARGYVRVCPGCPSPGVSGCPRVVLVQAWVPVGCPCAGVSLRGPCLCVPDQGWVSQGCPCTGVPACPSLSGCSRAVSLCGVPPGSPPADRQTGSGRAPSPPRRGLRGAQPGSA